MSAPDQFPPLILTLALDAQASAFFNAQRQAYFPPERNYLQAHLTLFHHLPGQRQAEIATQLQERCRTLAPMPLQVTGVQFLGQGVAYRLDSAAVDALHRELQALWQADLTPQDQQRRRPHVTVQNKVRPEVARALHAQLTAEFVPFEAVGTGLQLWAYRGGPWEALATFAFGA
ncbi:2'-5' RNA ligase family protein [Hymenobacter persicinus]|uniref:2'-5' RNA ligase family protein n=1 Tax=Hymenobacter persicinus TaxID=2025506 RepID=A0A4Q5LEH4_9BACT|nr:2'-5' RNA ligase family protein [Hymenobacter persicinus]RYU82827.1 2'-5' RNA ligase family protein [Hymenobacter persicinus]